MDEAVTQTVQNISWIKDVIYLIPLGTLIWNAAKLSGKVKQNEKDIKELQDNNVKTTDEILKKLDDINKSITELKCDISALKAVTKDEQK